MYVIRCSVNIDLEIPAGAFTGPHSMCQCCKLSFSSCFLRREELKDKDHTPTCRPKGHARTASSRTTRNRHITRVRGNGSLLSTSVRNFSQVRACSSSQCHHQSARIPWQDLQPQGHLRMRLWYPHRCRFCVVRRTGPFSRAGVSGALSRAGTAVRNGSESDVIYYLNRTRLPVIGTES